LNPQKAVGHEKAQETQSKERITLTEKDQQQRLSATLRQCFDFTSQVRQFKLRRDRQRLAGR
jgi:hypothetical protein